MMLDMGLIPGNQRLPGSIAPWWELLYPEAVLVADFSNNRSVIDGAPVELTDFLTITRSSAGYAENADGSLTGYGADEFRLSDRGVLIEPASTNLVTDSQNLNGAGWSVTGSAAVTGNAIAAPDGALTGALVSALAASGDGVRFDDPSSATIAGTSHVFSVWLKSDDPGPVELTISASEGAASMSSVTVTPETGWKRFSLTHTFAPDNADFAIQISRPAGSSIQSLGIWGVQLEPGTSRTSDIKTSGTGAQRAADGIQFTNLSWLNAVQGTIIMDVQSDHGTISNRRILGFASAQGLDTSPSPTVIEEWNGNTLLVASSPGQNWITGAKIGLSWDASGRSLCIGGGTVAYDNEEVTGLTSWYLGSRDGTQSFWNGYHKTLVYWSSRKNDSFLVSVTS